MRWRPPIFFTAAYGAGLATGLLHFGSPFGVAVVGAGAVILGRPHVTVVAAAGLLGRVAAEIAVAADQADCAARLTAGLRIRMDGRALEPVDSEGGLLQLEPIGAGCTGAIAAQWPRGAPIAAGQTARVIGRWNPRPGTGGRPGGILLVSEASPAIGTPGFGGRLRTGLFRASRALYGARAPMVDALILGRRGGIDPEVKLQFARAGLIHLLSISGFHVGLVAAWVFLLVRLVGVGRSRALTIAAIVSTGYVAFLGWPAPATRAAALSALLARCQVRQRHVQADALLAATCLGVLLVDPWAILDLGAWLSAAALWGATTVTRWSDRALGEGFGWRTLGSSVGATLATAPITAYALGTVALVGVGLNFIAIPAAAVAVPGVLASLLLFPIWHWGAEALAGGAGLMLHLLELAARLGAGLPGAFSPTAGELKETAPWVLALLATLWCLGRRNTLAEAIRRTSWVGTAGLWAHLVLTTGFGTAGGGHDLALHFLDVGQGDAALVRTPGGRWVLIDAGPVGAKVDAGRRVVLPFLARHGATGLSLVVVSHAHADHLGGVPSVLARYHPGLVLEPGVLAADPLYTGFLATLGADTIPWHAGKAGETFALDGVRFTVLHPVPGWPHWGEDLNEDSLVLLVEYGDFQALFAGDAGFPAESAMAARIRDVDVLKVGHHGSRGSTGDAWLDALRPRVGVISVGNNEYGHPAPQTLQRLEAHGVRICRTDRDGTITVTSDGRRMAVHTRAGDISYDTR